MFFFFRPIGESRMRDVLLCQFGHTLFSTKSKVFVEQDIKNLWSAKFPASYNYKQPSVLLWPQQPLVAIPSGEMTRREWVPHIDPGCVWAGRESSHPCLSGISLRKALVFLWSFYLTGVTSICWRTMEITPTHAVGPLPYSKNNVFCNI